MVGCTALGLLASENPSADALLHDPSTGVLPYQALIQMCRERMIISTHEFAADQFQPASLDLRLGPVAYRVRASFLPGPDVTVAERIRELDGYKIDLTSGAVLERGCVYIIPLLEALALKDTVMGLANPKSSTGRLDILTRLIADRSATFDQVARGYEGPLFVELAPRTFSVVVRTGSRLNQLRFRRGSAQIAPSELARLLEDGHLVIPHPRDRVLKDGRVGVTVDLVGNGPAALVGYRAQKYTDRIDLDRIGHYRAADFWEPIRNRGDGRIILDPDDFYILATREAVAVPDRYAAEMVAYDTIFGEFRVHYAGFFDPGFGCGSGEPRSKAVLEVRSHEVPFMLEHGQTIGWLRYERMARIPDRIYGTGIGSHYQDQGLCLAKQFYT